MRGRRRETPGERRAREHFIHQRARRLGDVPLSRYDNNLLLWYENGMRGPGPTDPNFLRPAGQHIRRPSFIDPIFERATGLRSDWWAVR